MCTVDGTPPSAVLRTSTRWACAHLGLRTSGHRDNRATCTTTALRASATRNLGYQELGGIRHGCARWTCLDSAHVYKTRCRAAGGSARLATYRDIVTRRATPWCRRRRSRRRTRPPRGTAPPAHFARRRHTPRSPSDPAAVPHTAPARCAAACGPLLGHVLRCTPAVPARRGRRRRRTPGQPTPPR